MNLTAAELVHKICLTHGYPPEKWSIYEVILDGDAERPLHFSEHVLGVIKSWSMPSTNYLVAKNDYMRDKMRWFKQVRNSPLLSFDSGFSKLSATHKCATKLSIIPLFRSSTELHNHYLV